MKQEVVLLILVCILCKIEYGNFFCFFVILVLNHFLKNIFNKFIGLTINCYDCSLEEEKCVNAFESTLITCSQNHTACAKYRSTYLGRNEEKVTRTCALKALTDNCFHDRDQFNNPIKICMHWCTTDGCNRSFMLSMNYKFFCFSFLAIFFILKLFK